MSEARRWLIAAVAVLATGCEAGPVSNPLTSPPNPATSSSVGCVQSLVPRAVTGMSAVYMASRNQIVEFGGDDATNTPVSDTWIRSGG